MRMMKKIKKISIVLLAVAIGVTTTFSLTGATVQATEYWPDSVSISSEAACVIDVDTGTILYENNADAQLYPASITKIMTVMLALENSELDEIVTFSEEAVMNNETNSSHIAREIGEEMTMEDCLYAIMLASANEVAWAVAEHVGGTVEEFVNMMNEKAAELGCTGTHFANPNGLHDVDHYVTAHDMALIAQAAFEIPEFQKICSTTAYTIPADNKKEEYYMNNSHAMISASSTSAYLYDYAIGGKTGYTAEAGYTLVTYAEKDGMTLAVVTLKATTIDERYNDTRTLFEYCFQNFTHFQVSEYVSISELNGTAATGLLGEEIDLIGIDSEGTIVLPNTASFVDATPTVSPSDDDGAVAKITYTYADREVGSANIIYTSSDTISYPFHNVDAAEGGSSEEYIRIDFKMILLVVVIILAVLVLLFFLYRQSGNILLGIRRSKKRKQREKTNKSYRTIRRNRKRRKALKNKKAAQNKSATPTNTSSIGGMRTRANAQRANAQSTNQNHAQRETVTIKRKKSKRRRRR